MKRNNRNHLTNALLSCTVSHSGKSIGVRAQTFEPYFYANRSTGQIRYLTGEWLTSSAGLDKTGKACEVKQPPHNAWGMRVSNPVTPRRDVNARTGFRLVPKPRKPGTKRRGKMVIRRVHSPGECKFESCRRHEVPHAKRFPVKPVGGGGNNLPVTRLAAKQFERPRRDTT